MNEVVQSVREKVEAIERFVEQLPQVDCPVRHYFAPGLYAREMTIPAGVILTGAVHKTEHLCTVSRGVIAIESGEGPILIRAPFTFVSKPGVKRAGVALEETVFTTYHATTTMDLDALVEELTESTAAELLGGSKNKQLAVNREQEKLK